MKLYVSIDMEGVAGVVSGDHARRDHPEYARFRRLMTGEANAVIAGAFAAGAEGVVVNDSHGGMSNVLIEELDERALLLAGTPKPYSMMQGIGEEFDAVALIGYHAASGTGQAVLEHTSTGFIHRVVISGRTVGELGMNALLAAHFGVPVVLVSGDLALTVEARNLLGDIKVVVTKEAATRTAALCRSPSVVREELTAATQAALESLERAPLLEVSGPQTLEVEFHRAAHADMAGLVPGSKREDGRTVSRQCVDIFELHRTYRAMLALAAGA